MDRIESLRQRVEWKGFSTECRAGRKQKQEVSQMGSRTGKSATTIGALLLLWSAWPGDLAAQTRQTLPRAGAARGARVAAAEAAPQAGSLNVRASLDAIYQQAAQANTMALVNQCLEDCRALPVASLDTESRAYLNELEAWLLNRRGEAYAQAAGRVLESGDEQQSIRYEEQAITDYSDSLARQISWRPYHNRGVSQAMLGKYDDATASFTEAIKLNPDYPNSRFNLAELWLELERWADAEREYSEVLRLDPEDIGAQIGRGHARFYLHKYDEALADFDAVLQKEPENAVVYADRADLRAFLGQWEQAAEDYRAAIQLDRGLGRAYQSAAWLMATCPDERYRDQRNAVRAAQRAIELDGTSDYRYLDTLAAAHANAQQFPEAVKSLQQALAVAPEKVATDLRGRLALYQTNRPFRDQR